MARNIAATDAGVGQASITTKIKLTIQAAKKCFYFGALPCFVVPLVLWAFLISPQNFDIVKIHAISAFSDSSIPRKWRIRDDSAIRRIVTVSDKNGQLVQYFTPHQIMEILKPASNAVAIFYLVFISSWIFGILGYWFVWQKFVQSGLDQQRNKRIRGAKEIISAQDLNQEVLKDGSSDYKLIDIALPANSPMQGILAIGAQGSGKSLAIHDFMNQVFAKKRKCIIYDQSGEFYRAYFREGKDFYFNPACFGSVPWSIFEEIKYSYDANTLAQAFLPPKAGAGHVGANSFFEDAARALFSVILLRLAERGAKDTKDIATAFLEMPDDEMNILIQKSVASSAIGGDSKGQRQGVISSIAIYLDGISAVKSGSWSISDFLKADDDARLFLVGTEDTKAMFAPLYRLILAVAFSSIASMQKIVHEDKYWFFLDEIHTLGDIKVDEQLATLRKFGVCVFAGTQNDTQFTVSVGKDRAEVLMNGFHTLLQLQMNDPNAQDRAAKRLGKLEMETIGQNQAVAVVEQRDGAGIVITEQEKWLVMPADIGQLGSCRGYLKIAGHATALVDYRNWLPKKRGVACRADKFKEIHGSPTRDASFVISRKVLANNQTAFDDVRLQAEAERLAEAELQEKNEKDIEGSNLQVAAVISHGMTAGTSVEGIHRENSDGNNFEVLP